VQCPYSGLGCATCSLRSSTCRSASSGPVSDAQDSNHRARSWASMPWLDPGTLECALRSVPHQREFGARLRQKRLVQPIPQQGLSPGASRWRHPGHGQTHRQAWITACSKRRC
jgi:hypothetical protein